MQVFLFSELSKTFYSPTQIKLKKYVPAVTFMCFLNLKWLLLVMIAKLTLFAEQEIVLPLIIKIKIYSCLLQEP